MGDNDVLETLERVKERRERLGSAADGLERAITRAAGDEQSWRTGVRSALDEVRAALDAHVDEVEAPGGLYTDIITRSPRLTHGIERLRHDHLTMSGQIADLEAALAPDGASVETTRESALVLIAEISRHRHRGADLLWDSYDLDIGAGD